MRKILVIGCPGSGKSTFSKALHKKTGIPLFHLDNLYWNADKTTVPKGLFLERLTGILSGSAWIIDGNYASTMEQRIKMCDTVIFLDYPKSVCLAGVQARLGKARSDMPWTETEKDPEFIRFIENFEQEQKPKIRELLETYKHKRIVVFSSRSQADGFLEKAHKA